MQHTQTIASRTYGRGGGMPEDEMRVWLSSGLVEPTVDQAARAVHVQQRAGPVLVLRRGGKQAAVGPGVVELPVYDGAGTVLFRMSIEVLIDVDQQRVVRGAQTITPIPGGPEPTASKIKRDAQLGDAWTRAVEALTVDEAPTSWSGLATAHSGEPRVVEAVQIDRLAEIVEVARVSLEAADAGGRASDDDLARALSKLRGSVVSPAAARRRKWEARKAGKIPAATSTRPKI